MSNPHSPPHQDKSSGDALQFPEPAHVREPSESTQADDTDSDDEEIEATELRRLAHLPVVSHILTDEKPIFYWYDSIKKFWRHNIRISVPHDDCRDHLANERTFLGYLRDSIALSIMGIIIAQLYRLEHSPHPSKVYGYYVLSKPVSVVFQSAALCMISIGAIRFFRQQNAMALGKARSGGWEILVISLGAFLLLFMMLALVIGVDIYQAYHPEQDWAP